VEAADFPALARRILATAVHGDEVDKRLYALHTQKRLDALRHAAQATGQDTPAGFGEAAQALYQLQAGLVWIRTWKASFRRPSSGDRGQMN
jgi:hypothetical protein